MTLVVSRSRGLVSGIVLVLLGAWGALVPFIGPYFHFGYTPDSAWTYTSGRLWLSIIPGAVTLVGGLILLISRVRPVALTGAALAAIGGAWFAVGSVLTPIWNSSLIVGTPVGSPAIAALEQIAFFTGLGIVVVLFAALAIGRLSVIGVRDARLAKSRRAAAETDTVSTNDASQERLTTNSS